MAWKISDKVPKTRYPIYREAIDGGHTWIVVAKEKINSDDLQLTKNRRYRVGKVFLTTDEGSTKQEEVTDIYFKIRDDRGEETFANIDDFREYWDVVDRKVLLVDDDPDDYDTKYAMKIARDRLLERYNVRWGIDVVDQKSAMDVVNAIRPDAVIVDNDFGKGLVTAHEIMVRTPGALPLGYVTSYNREQLGRFRENLVARACADGGIATLDQMDKRGVKLMRKRGKTVSQSQLLCNQATDMYMFLGNAFDARCYSHERFRVNEWDDAPADN